MTASPIRLAAAALAAAIVAAAAFAFTASTTVPGTNAGRQQLTIDANALKPAFCASLDLTAVVAGVDGTAGNDLILGPAAGSTIHGNGGVDCIVGGGGNDTLWGNGPRNGDYCIGGPGTDGFKQCQNTQQ
jgi:Ca2+-binding RTX toxin-like protein